MKVLLAWDGDNVGRLVGRASLADDTEAVRRISQSIDRGNEIWKSWVIMNGGSIISMGGDEGRAEILAEHLSELPKIRIQYSGAVGSSVSVGVGTKLSEADRALMAAKIRGGDQIVLYDEDVDEELAEEQKSQGQHSEIDKLAEEYLNKAQSQEDALNSPAAGGGMTGPGQNQAPDPGSAAPEASEHSQGEAAQQMMQNDNPPQPEMTNSAGGAEDQFHTMAQQQDQKDNGQPAVDPNAQGEQLKTQIVQVLMGLKEQAPVLEQVKQASPDTYKAITGLAQAVIAMAKQMNGEDPNHTSPKEVKDRATSQAQVEVPKEQEGDEKSSGDKDKKKPDTKKSEPAFEIDGDTVNYFNASNELVKAEQFAAPYLVKSETDFDPKDLEEGVALELGQQAGMSHTQALELAMHHLAEDPQYYKKLSKEIEKAKLDKASLSPSMGQSAPQHHHLNLPVGSQVDPAAQASRNVGRIKVQHGNGKQGWIQARAGQIMSEDGHAISSRNPGGK